MASHYTQGDTVVIFVEWPGCQNYYYTKVFYLNEVNIKGAKAYRPILNYCEIYNFFIHVIFMYFVFNLKTLR